MTAIATIELQRGPHRMLPRLPLACLEQVAIGDSLIATDDTGSTITGTVDRDTDGAPILRLDGEPEPDATSLVVRKPQRNSLHA
jgi:hypothetical protein